MIADFRSDTLTKPSQEMLEVMRAAPLGDDVFGEDPSVNEFEARVAAYFGKEAAVFCPSGTMANQIAIRMHTKPGDEVICDELSHVYLYEGGGIAANSGASVRLLHGNRGRLNASQVANAIQADDPHFPKSRLVSLENTCNKGGGSIYAINEVREIASVCKKHSLALHLDGARLFNALVESTYSAPEFAAAFDSLSVCFSKGLGAPVGSVLIASKAHIHQARRLRKLFGGGMRQAGSLAAAALFALENNVDRLKEDHRAAKYLEKELAKISFIESIAEVHTNIVILHIASAYDAGKLLIDLKNKGVLAVGFGPQKIRLVSHLDITEQMLEFCVRTFKTLDK